MDSSILHIVDVVESVSERFNGTLNKTEKRLLDEVLNLTKEISTTNGRINSSLENLRLLSKIKSKLSQMVLSKEYLSSVRDLARGMDGILNAQTNYFSSLAGKDFKGVNDIHKKFEITQKLSIDSVVQGLTRTGIESNVTSKISDMLLRSIVSGGMYADLVKDMSDFLTTTENKQGALTRYAQTWVNTSLNQYAGQNNKLLTDDLGLEWFMYVGSNKESTREFCEHLKEKKYVHISEIPEIVKGNIDGHQCEIYERTGLPKGMIEGTTADNFQVNNGGWNCGHKLTPVANEAVPKEIRAKFESVYKKESTGEDGVADNLTGNNLTDFDRKITEAQDVETVGVELQKKLTDMLGYEVEVKIDASVCSINYAKNNALEFVKLAGEYNLNIPITKIEIRKQNDYGLVQDVKSVKHLFLNGKNSSYQDIALKNYSQADDDRIKYTNLTHEFAHCLFTPNGRTNKFWKQEEEFIKERDDIWKEYNKEVKKTKINQLKSKTWYIGKYGTDNIEDFMAECFSEYINYKKPSKYSKRIGDLINKYYKKKD